MVIFVWVTTQDLPLCFLLQILEKIVENPSNRICADCGMKGNFTGQTPGLNLILILTNKSK